MRPVIILCSQLCGVEPVTSYGLPRAGFRASGDGLAGFPVYLLALGEYVSGLRVAG